MVMKVMKTVCVVARKGSIRRFPQMFVGDPCTWPVDLTSNVYRHVEGVDEFARW